MNIPSAIQATIPNQGRRMARSGGSDDAHAAYMFDDWIRAHPNGTQIEVRLDPRDSQNAELVDMKGLPALR